MTAVVLLPPVQAALKAIPVLAEAAGFRVPRPFASTVEREETALDGVVGDLYLPSQAAPAIVLIPGAAPQGKDDPRVRRVARSIARAERVVFVPQLELSNRRFTYEDIDRIVRSVGAVAEHPRAIHSVQLLGFSYGGSFALIAAADPRIAETLDQVAVFGAYFDLTGVVQAVTTGVSLVDGRRIEWKPHPQASRLLMEYAVELAPEDARSRLRAALEGRVGRDALPAPARSIYDFLQNTDPSRTYPLARRLPQHAERLLRRFSPSSVAQRLRAPVIAMHSTDDPAVPYGEAVRLRSEVAGAKLFTVTLFRHVDFNATSLRDWRSAIGDLWSAWQFTSEVMRGQE